MQFMGAAGVALAISLSAICQVMMLYMLWNRRTQNHESRGVYLILEKVTLISLIIGIILESFKKNYLLHIDSSVFSGSLAICLIIGAVFIPLFLAFGYIFRIEEMRIFLTKIIRRIR